MTWNNKEEIQAVVHLLMLYLVRSGILGLQSLTDFVGEAVATIWKNKLFGSRVREDKNNLKQNSTGKLEVLSNSMYVVWGSESTFFWSYSLPNLIILCRNYEESANVVCVESPVTSLVLKVPLPISLIPSAS
jgi:hypothetical protein